MEANDTTIPRAAARFGTIDWLKAASLAVLAIVVYLANGHDIGTEDTQPTTLVPHAIASGDGLNLRRFAVVLSPGGEPLACVAWKRGSLVTRFPVATGVVATPLVWPQRLVYDRLRPDWRSHPLLEWRFSLDIGKHAAACIVALVVICTFRLLHSAGLARAALPATLVMAFGSELWTIGSQALWQHGPAALMLVLALQLLMSERQPARLRTAAAGACAALMCAIRLVDLVFAAAIFLWVLRFRTRSVGWLLLGMAPIVALTLAHNVYWFGTPLGGQTELDALHPQQHAITAAWSANPLPGMAGTLISPSRGLLVFMPWVLVVVLVYPWSRGEMAAGSLCRWMVISLVPYLSAVSAYGVWWGGFCYGPRYWTETSPILALMFGCAWQWAGRFKHGLRVGLVITAAWAVGLQALGAFCYPSSWNLTPQNVDTHHDRLWDWSDSEVSRCIREKLLK